MAIVLTGVVEKAQRYELKEQGLSGVTIRVLDMGQDMSVSTDDQAIGNALLALTKGARVQIPVRYQLSTFGGTAKVKFKAVDLPQTQPAR